MLRAVAALLVLLYHLATATPFAANREDRAFGLVASACRAVGFAGVDLFFVISGVVMAATCYERFGRRDESRRFLLRRLVRIYPLYWTATAVVLAIALAAPQLTAREPFTLAQIAKSIVLWPQTHFPVVAVGWTLTYEMFFYLVFAALLVVPRRTAALLLVLWAVVTIALYPVSDLPNRPMTAQGYLALSVYASPLVLEFIAGCAIGRAARRQAMPVAALTLLVGVTVLVAAGGFVGVTYPAQAQYGALRVVTFGGAAALIAYGAVGLELAGRLRIPRWVVFWGDASYATYLTHVYVILLVARFWPRPTADGSLGWLAALSCLAVCSAVAATVHIWFERPLHRRLITALSSAARPPKSHAPTNPLAAGVNRS